jgi:hypothetical protein
VTAAQQPRAGGPGEYLPDLLAPLPPVSPGDVPAGNRDLWGGERDPAGNWGVDYGKPLPSVADSPHWAEIGGAT